MLRKQNALVCLILASSAFLAPRLGLAVHKSWVIRNDGSQCAFNTPNPSLDNYYSYAVHNGATYTRSIGCPLALSARWGSTSPAVSQPLWAGAHAANIYVNNQKPGTEVSCTTRALLASGVTRYSRTAKTTAGGDQRLTTATGGGWGGTLETYEEDNVLSMYFDCSLPGNYSAVYGYKVRICQRLSFGADCGTNDHGENYIAVGAGADYIQASGIECYSDNNNEVRRTHSGLVNSNAGYSSVYCPLSYPADDTSESNGYTNDIRVHFKPAVANQYPICQLSWRDRSAYDDGRADEYWSEAFLPSEFNAYVYRPKVLTHLPVGAAVYCDLPPGMTLQGVTASPEVTAVNNGG
jgi:hypothetical protein